MAAPSPAPLPSALDASQALVDPVLEVRLAVVLYGGVSLAIYINGVAQELLSLARATAPRQRPAAGAVPPLLADDALDGAEPVYREIGRRLHLPEEPWAKAGAPGDRWTRALGASDPIGTAFIVDVLSGTSAGGINGVFLAKALANQQTLEGLRELWITEGDIDLLLHDEESRKGMPPGYRLPREASSLLNSQRMYRKLHEALSGLDASNPAGETQSSPYVDEMDLYVTATDLSGVVVPVQLSDRAVFERRHRSVFHFLYAKRVTTGDERNDFTANNNAFLAFAARCTSSFPFAFEPMTLEDVRVFENSGRSGDKAFAGDLERWSPFFRDYLMASRVVGAVPNASESDFPRRAFGDGGYLDNKPFSYAIDAICWRRSSGRVVRKLIYVEPSPEHSEDDTRAHERPDALENLIAASSAIPRNETIREDVERVRERNGLIERINRATRTIEADVVKGFTREIFESEAAASAVSAAPGAQAAAPASATSRVTKIDFPCWASTSAWASEGLQEMTMAYGPAFPSYHRLKVAEVTTDLAELVTRVAGLDEASQDFVAIRYLVSAWRQNYYTLEKPRPDDDRKTENSLLLSFDLAYRLRRLGFVDSRIDALLAFDGYAYDVLKGEFEGSVKELDRAWGDPAWRAALERELRGIKRELGEQFMRLRRRGRHLRSRETDNEMRECILRLGVTRADLAAIVTPRAPRERVARAKQVLGEHNRMQMLHEVSETLARLLREEFEEVSAACVKLLETTAERPAPADIPAFVRSHLKPLYDHFDAYDMILFPIRSGTEYGEGVEVETVRISPEDASCLVPEFERPGKRLVSKLAGTRLGNFGGFLEKRWRQSDMMWGRLDAAERLIHSMIPTPVEVADRYVARAQAGIVRATVRKMGIKEGRRMLIECAIRTESGKPQPGLVRDLANRLREHVPADDIHTLAILDAGPLLDLYERTFRDEATGLERETTLRLAARATRITGRVLDAVNARSGRLGRRVPFILTTAGRMLWTLIEIAAPRSLQRLVFTYWLGLLYLLEFLLWGGGHLLKSPEAIRVSWGLFTFTLLLDVLRRLVGFWFVKSKWLQFFGLALVAFVAFLLVTGWDDFIRLHWPALLHQAGAGRDWIVAAVRRR